MVQHVVKVYKNEINKLSFKMIFWTNFSHYFNDRLPTYILNMQQT